MSLALISSLGALLKYELHAIGHRDASVLVSMTSAEWTALQASVQAEPASDLQKATGEALAAATVTPKAGGKVDVQLAAGDYAKVHDAHAAAKPAEAAPESPAPDPRDARIAELEAQLADKGAAKKDLA